MSRDISIKIRNEKFHSKNEWRGIKWEDITDKSWRMLRRFVIPNHSQNTWWMVTGSIVQWVCTSMGHRQTILFILWSYCTMSRECSTVSVTLQTSRAFGPHRSVYLLTRWAFPNFLHFHHILFRRYCRCIRTFRSLWIRSLFHEKLLLFAFVHRAHQTKCGNMNLSSFGCLNGVHPLFLNTKQQPDILRVSDSNFKFEIRQWSSPKKNRWTQMIKFHSLCHTVEQSVWSRENRDEQRRSAMGTLFQFQCPFKHWKWRQIVYWMERRQCYRNHTRSSAVAAHKIHILSSVKRWNVYSLSLWAFCILSTSSNCIVPSHFLHFSLAKYLNWRYSLSTK